MTEPFTPTCPGSTQSRPLKGQRPSADSSGDENTVNAADAVTGELLSPAELYKSCGDIFADYPLAIKSHNSADPEDNDCTSSSVVLMMQAGDSPRFFVLSAEAEQEALLFILRPWRSTGAIEVGAGGQSTDHDAAEYIITHSVPMPRDGSLFGWKSQDSILALIVFYAEYTPMTPEPGWAVMPLVGTTQSQWPPFTGQRFFDDWFWGYAQAGKVISLDDVIAETKETFFWVDTEETLGWDSCAVTQDVPLPEGSTIPRGLYVFHSALSAGGQAPSLDSVLSSEDKFDLGSAFRGF